MSNLESVRGLYEAFAKGDVPTVLAFLDANIAWTQAEGFPYAGTYNGPNAMLERCFHAARLGVGWVCCGPR
ncbi:MAG: nuclear transport factor 2 family protein [Pyrinomonadaceae bacterium]